MTVRIVVLCGAVFLTGCTTCYERETTAADPFESSLEDCEAKQKAAGGGPAMPFGGRDVFMEECMKAHGWNVKPR